MDYVGIAAMLVAIIFSLGVHEAAHGWAAERFGDPTARELGRITLNPIKHIDPVFTILVPIVLFVMVGFAFGGAKPVPFNPMRFRPGTNIKRAIMWIAAAGPISNFVLAFVAMLISQLALAYTNPGVTAGFTFRLLSSMVTINILLGMFNLLPIPPLDGAKVLAGFLPNSLANMMYRLERFALIFFFIIIYSNVGRYIMKPMDWMETQYGIVVAAIVRLLT